MATAETDRRRGFPLGWVLLAVVVVALLVRTIDVLIIVFLAIILAVFFDAVSGFLQRRAELLPEARQQLAMRIAQPLYTKYGGNFIEPELYLDRLIKGRQYEP